MYIHVCLGLTMYFTDATLPDNLLTYDSHIPFPSMYFFEIKGITAGHS